MATMEQEHILMDTRQRNGGTAPVSFSLFFFLFSRTVCLYIYLRDRNMECLDNMDSSPQIVVVRERAAESASRINKREEKKKDIPGKTSERSGLTNNF